MKKGFTLVELLAVIVILAIILAIAIPGISGLIGSSTRNAFENDAKMLIRAIDYKQIESGSFYPSDVNETTVTALLNISDINYQTILVSSFRNNPYVVIMGKNKWSGLVAYGTYQSMNVEDDSYYDAVISHMGYDAAKGVNEPKLAKGMKPIKWDSSNNRWIETSAADADWYNYNTTDKKWANARTADGSMWVWIPRYIYKISTGWHSNTAGTIDIQFSKGTDDNWNNSVIGNIDTGTTSNASNNKWTNHPSFNFDKELTGLWVAKFEATAAEGVANGNTVNWSCPIEGDNVTTKTVKILPNVASWRCISVGNMFTVSRNMEINATYGWGTSGKNIDTHLMKNTEWGAVSYLSKSQYGKNTDEIWLNNSQPYTTGCTGTVTSDTAYNGCRNAYGSTDGVKASTTGTIYGIYDISGGSWEYVAAYINNGSITLNQGSAIINADDKYKNVYTPSGTDDQATNYDLTIGSKGDAVYETSSAANGSYSWFNDRSYMPTAGTPWFIRGGQFISGSYAGANSFDHSGGDALSIDGFRPVLVVELGL